MQRSGYEGTLFKLHILLVVHLVTSRKKTCRIFVTTLNEFVTIVKKAGRVSACHILLYAMFSTLNDIKKQLQVIVTSNRTFCAMKNLMYKIFKWQLVMLSINNVQDLFWLKSIFFILHTICFHLHYGSCKLSILTHVLFLSSIPMSKNILNRILMRFFNVISIPSWQMKLQLSPFCVCLPPFVCKQSTF